ncbi:coniferyl aldehyde dehydrogenase [Hydrocarboniclastica marina]|uniref:Aldehyde dehydrogenase n=1 Tax=Hydrocarboniclastica marina TaxID=2259620 RepID=A0A4P7XJX1_9ALTE|nr:coniferyl aldehyde dehydrogenase [Hydrocarboniclastica marina]MAL97405.1 coniferyl-aldehyde dehydrogenase [Alteromonadaceae bacterium]QCF27298.1 coniferyl aldehyde dehydrogenase [Hydrocarboniclastica marina]|tara:strand:+ start:6975 stop:8420 length:1446 start_codon:yes stop_codon:yes gene_type:complete
MVANVVELTENKKQIQQLQRLFAAQQTAFQKNRNPSVAERRENLKRLKKMLLDNQEAIIAAIDTDFSCRSADETRLAELMPAVQGIDYAAGHLSNWMKPSKRHVSLLFQPASNKVYFQPKGVVGIIVPWNYPLYLAVGPLVAALAAGNRAMLKMSEFTPEFSALFKDLLQATFAEDLVAVVNGDAEVAAAFSGQPFNHLLFTGSTQVGRLVMKAAADNLTPVTLELGGKSPALVSPDVPIADAAKRIAFGKAFNAGQTCVAPDYVLCPADRVDAFVDEFKAAMGKLYPTVKDNSSYTSIVNDRQHARLTSYLDDARKKGARVIEVNAANDQFGSETRKMPVHLVLDATDDMLVMQEEIFGPLLPVVPYQRPADALQYINDRPHPLALYYFGYDKKAQSEVMERTQSGGMGINDTLMHVAQDDLPFGGVGPSGIGHYHGKEGFLTFSHARSVFSKQRFNSSEMIYPPYGGLINKLVYRLFIR